MDDIILRQIQQPIIDILNNRISLYFIKCLFEFELIFQVTLIAEFGDDVAISVAGEDLVASEYAGMVEFFEDVDLLEK